MSTLEMGHRTAGQSPGGHDERQLFIPGQEPSNDRIHTGVWEATPGETRSIKGDSFEFCQILSGIVEITPEGGAPVRYSAGDRFVLKPGFVGIWKTIETVRKIYVVVS